MLPFGSRRPSASFDEREALKSTCPVRIDYRIAARRPGVTSTGGCGLIQFSAAVEIVLQDLFSAADEIVFQDLGCRRCDLPDCVAVRTVPWGAESAGTGVPATGGFRAPPN